MKWRESAAPACCFHHKCSEDFLDLKKAETGRIDTRMTRIEQIVTDFVC